MSLALQHEGAARARFRSVPASRGTSDILSNPHRGRDERYLKALVQQGKSARTSFFRLT